jgi:hypothetical protein
MHLSDKNADAEIHGCIGKKMVCISVAIFYRHITKDFGVGNNFRAISAGSGVMYHR